MVHESWCEMQKDSSMPYKVKTRRVLSLEDSDLVEVAVLSQLFDENHDVGPAVHLLYSLKTFSHKECLSESRAHPREADYVL